MGLASAEFRLAPRGEDLADQVGRHVFAEGAQAPLHVVGGHHQLIHLLDLRALQGPGLQFEAADGLGVEGDPAQGLCDEGGDPGARDQDQEEGGDPDPHGLEVVAVHGPHDLAVGDDEGDGPARHVAARHPAVAAEIVPAAGAETEHPEVVPEIAAVLREFVHEAHDLLVGELPPGRELELRAAPLVPEFAGEDLRLRVGENPVHPLFCLLDDEGEARPADRVGVEEAGDGADVDVDRRHADELPVPVVDRRGQADPRDRPCAASERSPLGPDRPLGVAGQAVPFRQHSRAGQRELPTVERLSPRIVFGREVEDHRLAGLAVEPGLADAEPAFREALDGKHQAVLEAGREEREVGLRLHDPLQVAGQPVQRLRLHLDGAQDLAVHLALVTGAGEERADPVPDAQGTLVQHLRREGVGVSLQVVVGQAPEEQDRADEHDGQERRQGRAEGDAGGCQFLREGGLHVRFLNRGSQAGAPPERLRRTAAL